MTLWSPVISVAVNLTKLPQQGIFQFAKTKQNKWQEHQTIEKNDFLKSCFKFLFFYLSKF
jgi:hypothetical protein